MTAVGARGAGRSTAFRPMMAVAAVALLALVGTGLGALAGQSLLITGGVSAVLALAFANGANDVSKGVATLAGAGVTDYRRALAWGTVWTGAGASLSVFLSGSLVSTFSSQLLTAGSYDERAAIAVLLAAGGWVLAATLTGLPVSTTHALTGAIIGIGLADGGPRAVAWSELQEKVALPLILSPLSALVLALIVYGFLRTGMLPRRARIDLVHGLSSGTVSFARGMNDAPKIVAVGAVFVVTADGTQPPLWLFLAVAAAMTAGSWLGGRCVTVTLAERVTRISDREGLGANAATATLVGLASHWGFPVSTTHVASAAIAGVAIRRGPRALRWATLGQMAVAWLVTLPLVAVITMALSTWVGH